MKATKYIHLEYFVRGEWRLEGDRQRTDGRHVEHKVEQDAASGVAVTGDVQVIVMTDLESSSRVRLQSIDAILCRAT